MAVRIDFAPLRTSLVPIPPSWHWVVAHSLVRAEKSGAAREAYNTRAAECRNALAVVSAGLGVEGAGFQDLIRLDGVVEGARGLLDSTLFRRFRHVMTEARRVDAAQTALVAGSRAEFGALMSASHASLRDDFEVSIPELDEMTFLAESAGATGARLTGAGFGGCMVALCDDDTAPAVRESLVRSYYAPRGVTDLVDVLFEAAPSDGARVVTAVAD
jgi:galactokinase